MKHLTEFINKYKDYNLLNTLTYNSYRVEWRRNYTRDYDSVSTSEMLSLIEDCNLEMVKTFHWDKMKSAATYWTMIHKEIEDFINTKKPWTTEQFKHFRLFCLKEWVWSLRSEINHSIELYEWLPLTWEVDAEWIIDSDSITLDWKTTRNVRAFISVKQKLQIRTYMMFNKTKRWWLVYLTSKWYKFIELTEEEIEYYWLIVSDLMEYTKWLLKEWRVNNLYKN